MSIKVFFNPRQNVNDNNSFSPSAGKPTKVAEQYVANFDVEIREDFKPLTRSLISLAHSTSYVYDLLNLKTSNGFGNKLPSVAEATRWTTGSFAAAALHAYKNKTATCSLTSGFHHACYNGGGGFCTFNGLVIAAQILKLKYGIKQVGIIDFDEHFGNGTEDIKSKLNLNYINHRTLGRENVGPETADEWLDKLEQELLAQFQNADIILYQAGADCWTLDPLGGRFTKSQLSQRDEIVFRVAKKIGKPIAWNLAGGYSSEFGHVLDIHNNTMAMCSYIMEGNESALEKLHLNDEIPSAKSKR
jgi:acetoin utilization deacetylase AcuC-like enzyme